MSTPAGLDENEIALIAGEGASLRGAAPEKSPAKKAVCC